MPRKVTRTLAIQVRTKCRSVSTQTRPQTRSACTCPFHCELTVFYMHSSNKELKCPTSFSDVQVNTAIRQDRAVQTDISATGDAWDILDRLHGTSSPISEQVPLPSEFLSSIHVECEGGNDDANEPENYRPISVLNGINTNGINAILGQSEQGFCRDRCWVLSFFIICQ